MAKTCGQGSPKHVLCLLVLTCLLVPCDKRLTSTNLAAKVVSVLTLVPFLSHLAQAATFPTVTPS